MALKFETTLNFLLFKSNFFRTRYICRGVVSYGRVLVNGLVIRNPYLSANIGDIIDIDKSNDKIEEFYLALSLVKDLFDDNSMIVNHPPYLEVSYKLLSIVVWRPPFRNEILSNFNPLSARRPSGFNFKSKHKRNIVIR